MRSGRRGLGQGNSQAEPTRLGVENVEASTKIWSRVGSRGISGGDGAMRKGWNRRGATPWVHGDAGNGDYGPLAIARVRGWRGCRSGLRGARISLRTSHGGKDRKPSAGIAAMSHFSFAEKRNCFESVGEAATRAPRILRRRRGKRERCVAGGVGMQQRVPVMVGLRAVRGLNRLE